MQLSVHSRMAWAAKLWRFDNYWATTSGRLTAHRCCRRLILQALLWGYIVLGVDATFDTTLSCVAGLRAKRSSLY